MVLALGRSPSVLSSEDRLTFAPATQSIGSFSVPDLGMHWRRGPLLAAVCFLMCYHEMVPHFSTNWALLLGGQEESD